MDPTCFGAAGIAAGTDGVVAGDDIAGDAVIGDILPKRSNCEPGGGPDCVGVGCDGGGEPNKSI